ncbi:MAG TPA: DUF366 family protein [Methanobacterium sp.]|jgi:hypothetical protein|nr:MAG: DUF366 family protein [Methanobacterium sp.]HPX77172.1 DUF366 family protein [Methanobacterium sp.]
MKYLKLEEELLYDGSQIEPQWVFREFGIKDSSIVRWIGPMDIHQDNIVDYEDQGKEIKGDKLLHFIIEHFDVQPADLRLCYHRQRLFILMVQDNLEKLGLKTQREGDDLYHVTGSDKKAKLSVSIATCSNNSMKIHFAMNISSEGTPSDVEITSLIDCIRDLTTEKVDQMADNIVDDYIKELSSIEKDITKTKVF